jgi:RimJ/RimL family protein N-acetyltransferase
VLSDGSVVEIRPVTRTDRELLEDGFARLGPTSRYQRFLSPVKRLSPRDLTYLTDVDHHDHEGLVAVEPDHGRLVGVARFVRSEPASDIAEVGIAVIDAWQQRGVGTALLHHLANRAHEEGVTRFSAYVLPDNRRVMEVLSGLGDVRVVGHEPGALELEIDLPREPLDARRLLRAAASVPSD